MQKLTRWVKTSLLIIGITALTSSCAHTVQVPVLALPPLPERPVLESIVADKNDQTGEKGVWMNFADLKKLVQYAERVEAVRRIWGKDKEE